MDSMDALQKYYSSPGNMGRDTFLVREGSAKRQVRVDDGELVPKNINKDDSDEARHTVEDHGFDPSSPEGKEKIREVLEAIRRKKRDTGVQKSVDVLIEKVTATRGRPSSGIAAVDRGSPQASAQNKPWFAAPARKVVDERYPDSVGDFQGDDSPKPKGSAEDEEYEALYTWFEGARAGRKPFCEKHNDCFKEPMSMEDEKRYAGSGPQEKSLELSLDCKECQQEPLQKAQNSPAVNALVAMAAGWALSSDITDKDVPAHLVREWERAVSQQDKTRLQEEMIRKLRHKLRKSEDDGTFLDDLQILYKDHAPLPPRYGLLWDAVKHRWTRPEKVGRTVWEVQGKKRLRGTGAGAHERSRAVRGSGGYGVGSAEAGRRFRTTGDVSKPHPHEAKHPGQRTLQPFGKPTRHRKERR